MKLNGRDVYINPTQVVRVDVENYCSRIYYVNYVLTSGLTVSETYTNERKAHRRASHFDDLYFCK